MQSGTQEKVPLTETVGSRPTWYIVRFLILWFASLIVVLAVTLLSDINWSRPMLERKLGEALSRRVDLGKMAWSFGLNGAKIETSKLNIRELSGAPFLSAGRSEVGVSVLAMLSRKLVINYIEADNADLHLVKTGKESWNFDDLVKPGPEIKLLQFTQSRIGIFDKADPDPARRLDPIKLEKVELKLNFPRKNKKRPFFLSFSLPSKDYATTFTVDGLGVGELEKWNGNQYSFEADAKNVNPRDLERLIKYVTIAQPAVEDVEKVTDETVARKKQPKGLIDLLNPVKGLFDIAVSGEGTFETGILATVNTSARGLAIDHPDYGKLDAGNTMGSLSAHVKKDVVAWKDLLLETRGIKLRSSGALTDWQEKDSSIKADLKGEIPDIGILQDIVKTKPGDHASGHGLSGLAQSWSPARLTGSAEIAIEIDGTAFNTNMTARVKTHDLAIKEMLARAHQQFPVLCAIGVSNQARIETDLKIQNTNRVEIMNGKLVGPGTNLKASGWLDLTRDKGEFTVSGDKIALNNAALALSSNDGAYKQVLGSIKLPGRNSFALGGTADANAKMTTNGDRFDLDAKIKLNDASFALKDNSLRLDKVGGHLLINQSNHKGTMSVSGITGRMGDGNFQMDGKLSLTKTPVIDMTLHATRFDLKHLSALMNLFQFHMPVLTERQLYGRVKDVVLKVTGTTCSPKIFFSAVPDDLYYQPPGLAKPLRAKAGVIVYDNDQLILREVALISNNKTILTSLTMDRVSKDAVLSRVKTKTDSIELADLHYYLSSTAMPPPLRKSYLDFLSRYKITGLNGKAYGDILCLFGKKGEMTFDGLLGCYKAGATISGYPLTKVDGIFAASGDQLLLQDLCGYIRGSKFSLDGYINKYRSTAPTWKAEVVATLAPREMIELIPHLTEELKTTSIELKSERPLTLRAKVQGNFDYNKVQYCLIANKKDKMIIEGPFGKIYQPDETPLTLDGLISFEKKKIDIGDTHLLIGETMLSIDGQLLFADTTVDMKQPTRINLTLKIPQKSPVKTLVSMVDPVIAKDISGTISGSITINGNTHNPRLVSNISVSDVDAKALNLSGLNGRLRSNSAPRQAEKESEEEDDDDDRQAESILEIDSIKIRQLPVTGLRAQVTLTPANGSYTGSGPVLVMNNGEARLADGIMKFQAKYQPADSAFWAKVNFEDVSAARLGDELAGRPDEISGKGQAEFEIETRGAQKKDLVKNLKGHGTIQIEDGVVATFSNLETRLTQYNLLTQGIFGFNFNNLLQSVWPVRTGEFNSLTNRFSFDDGKLKVEELRFNGKDMRIWGTGTANLETNNVQLEMAGKIPRVQESMLGGSIGTASRNITLQKMMKVVTFGRLESLPALPVLGAIATDKPRTFTFNVDSALDNPKILARSIEKSFKWLPNRPDATAHPIPGLVTAQ